MEAEAGRASRAATSPPSSAAATRTGSRSWMRRCGPTSRPSGSCSTCTGRSRAASTPRRPAATITAYSTGWSSTGARAAASSGSPRPPQRWPTSFRTPTSSQRPAPSASFTTAPRPTAGGTRAGLTGSATTCNACANAACRSTWAPTSRRLSSTRRTGAGWSTLTWHASTTSFAGRGRAPSSLERRER